MPSPVRFGLIGAGTVADYGHMPALTSLPDTELVLVADISEANLARAKDRFGVEGVLDYRALLARDDIEAVSICTPADAHREIAEAAITAGEAVLCEKPLAHTIADVRAIADAARRAGCIFAVDLHRRMTKRCQAVREAVARGEIGELQIMRFVMDWACHGIEGPDGERRARFMRVGGPMLDNGVHFFDSVRWYSGAEVASVVAQGQWVEPQFEFPGHVVALARMTNGVLAMVEMSFVYGHTVPADARPSISNEELIGADGVITSSHIYNHRGATPLPPEQGKQFSAVYAEFARCVRADTMEASPLATAEDGAQATEASLAAIEDAMRRRGAP